MSATSNNAVSQGIVNEAGVVASSTVLHQKDGKTVEQVVEETYADVPILVEVARCESQFRQTDSEGNILRGTVNKYDVGVMQINELYHEAKAVELGYDLYTLQGNLSYGRYLYDREGTRPWMASSACWSKSSEQDLAGRTDVSHNRG